MAAVVVHPDESVECGYCLVKDTEMVDPRALPCSHIHCYPCLVGDFDTNRIVRCGSCREVFDLTLARLPTATTREDNLQYCDVCQEKGNNDQIAVSYCTTCSRKMCTKHEEAHQDLHSLHIDVMTIEQYKPNAIKLEIRKCTNHETKPITMGCMNCYEPLCYSCINETQKCVDESGHRAAALDKLVDNLKKKRDEMNVEAYSVDERLSRLIKYSTKVLSEFETKTEEMIQILHTTRDEQISEIHKKYNKLEKDLLDQRKRSKDMIVEYMEGEVGIRLTELNTLLVLQDVRFRDAHQVDVITSHTETANEIKRLIELELPSLSLTKQIKLYTKARCRDKELILTEAANIDINEDRALGKFACPRSITLKKEVKVSEAIYSVCSYKGVTYVGTTGYIDKVNESDYSVQSFNSLDRFIEGISVHDDRLYVLAWDDAYKIYVCNLDGTSITSWDHANSSKSDYSKFTVMSDKVVVPNKCKNQLTVYSLEGQLIKHITFSEDDPWTTIAICAVDSKSVVVSSQSTSTVFRVNIETEEVMWTCTAVDKPGGVTCYGEGFVLVTPYKSNIIKIFIIDIGTGKYLGTLEDSNNRGSSDTLDLVVTGNTLLVPRLDEKTVYYYELINDESD